jgi:hypothetical protein
VIEQKIPFLKILEYTSVVSLLKKIFDMRGDQDQLLMDAKARNYNQRQILWQR